MIKAVDLSLTDQRLEMTDDAPASKNPLDKLKIPSVLSKIPAEEHKN